MSTHDVTPIEAKRRVPRASTAPSRADGAFDLDVDFEGRILRSRRPDPACVSGVSGLSGVPAVEIAGAYASDLFVADDTLTARALLHRATRSTATAPALLRMHRSDSGERLVQVTTRTAGDVVHLRIREADATEQHVFSGTSRRRARCDALTGLPNHLLLLERANAALATTPQTLVLIDVDRFRYLVTAVGSRVGDRILVEIADRLLASVRTSALVGLSGGHFAVVLPEVSGRAAIAALIREIRTAIGESLVANGIAIVFSTCFGIATSAQDAETLFADAEVALAHAQSLGPAHDAIFDPAFRSRAVHEVEMESDLSRAISDAELRLEYQPIVALETGGIVGYEALVRWQHPNRGRLAPGDFLATAQGSGSGVAIDDWVLAEACHEASLWARWGRPSNISVNVTPERFALAGFAERVADALDSNELDPGRLVVEITEAGVLADVGAARETLSTLKAMGVRVALDDFGTGCSSLADLAALRVDELKIDTHFVAGLGSDRVCTAITRAIVGIGNALGIAVVAEGIERPEQALVLRALECEFGQGFHFGRPAPHPLLLARVP